MVVRGLDRACDVHSMSKHQISIRMRKVMRMLEIDKIPSDFLVNTKKNVTAEENQSQVLPKKFNLITMMSRSVPSSDRVVWGSLEHDASGVIRPLKNLQFVEHICLTNDDEQLEQIGSMLRLTPINDQGEHYLGSNPRYMHFFDHYARVNLDSGLEAGAWITQISIIDIGLELGSKEYANDANLDIKIATAQRNINALNDRLDAAFDDGFIINIEHRKAQWFGP